MTLRSSAKNAGGLGSTLIAIIPPRLMMKNLLNHHVQPLIRNIGIEFFFSPIYQLLLIPVVFQNHIPLICFAEIHGCDKSIIPIFFILSIIQERTHKHGITYDRWKEPSNGCYKAEKYKLRRQTNFKLSRINLATSSGN